MCPERYSGPLDEGAALPVERCASWWLDARPPLLGTGWPMSAGTVPSATVACCHRAGRLTEAKHRSLSRERDVVSVYYQSR